MATLTRIGTVEGFGANIRFLQPGDMQRHFDESIAGTAIDHLGKGLFEAHGRDEAGWEEEAGHKDMWFAARDIAFEGRTADIDIDAMLERMGFGPPASGPGAAVPRILPSDIDENLERSEEHTSELQSLMRISYAVFCLKKKNTHKNTSKDV